MNVINKVVFICIKIYLQVPEILEKNIFQNHVNWSIDS